MQSQFCSSCLFPHPSVLSQHTPQQCQNPALEPQISFSPCPLHFHPLQGWKTLWLSTNRDSPTFPQAGPFLFKHPTYFIIILCPRGKDFFFSPPFLPLPSLVHSCPESVQGGIPCPVLIHPSCWPGGGAGAGGGDACSSPSSCLITSSKRARSFTAAQPTRSPTFGGLLPMGSSQCAAALPR